MNSNDSEMRAKPVTAGTSVFAITAILLIVLFFTPWFSACNVQVSGYDLAKGASTEASWWLFGIPLVGLAVIAIGISNVNQLLINIARKAQYVLLISFYPLLCMVLLFIQFRVARSDALLDLRPLVQFEVGFFGTILATLGMMTGAVLDWATGKGFKPETSRATGLQPTARSELPQRPPIREPPRPKAWLQGQAGSFANRSLELIQDVTRIGNGAECQICLREPDAAQVHAIVRYASGQYYLQEQNNPADTLLNGQRVRASVLRDGDIITIGGTKLKFRQL